MPNKLRVSALLLTAIALYAASAGFDSARRKLDTLESEHLTPGTRVAFSALELTAYAQDEAQKLSPGGIRDLRLELGQGRGIGFARIDFLKIKQAQKGGKPAGWMLARLLEGERAVAVTARLESNGGRAKVDVERVEVSGVAVEGRALEFLIQQYVIPYYPDAKVGQWFPLAHNVDHIEVTPRAATAVIGRNR